MEGLLNLDKPPGISSAAAVARVKYLLPRGTKIGHAGTLDPFATGVLVLLVGKATRRAEELMGQPKQYEATVKLGAITATLDPTSPEDVTPQARPVEREAVEAVLPRFVGTVEQLPPAFSALRINGQRAYDLARRGKEVAVQPRLVRIDGIELMAYDWPLLAIRVDCGRGTYIRSIARDIGAALGMGGYLTTLRRTRVGDCWIRDAVRIDELRADNVSEYLRS